MNGKCLKLFIFLLTLQSFVFSQDDPLIVDREDLNRSFYVKASLGAGNSRWDSHFPENVIDTSNRLNLPNQNKLRFSESGSERYISFSALFAMKWGKIGGGFETSTLEIDSLKETIDGQELNFSYIDASINFNRIFFEFESQRISLDEDKLFFLLFAGKFGTYIMTPSFETVLPRANAFVMLSPQIEHVILPWMSATISTAYEFRYFNTPYDQGNQQLKINNYLNSFNIRLGVKFRLRKSVLDFSKPIEERVE